MPAELLPWFITAAGVFGLLIGSFLNVVIWRVPRGESLLPDSHCPSCDQPIRPWQNVPVISWIALLGRCAKCRAPISVRYPLVELGTAVGYALVAWWYASAFAYPGLGFESQGMGGDAAGTASTASTGTAGTLAWWLGLAAFLWFAAASISLTMIDLDLKRLPDAIVLPTLGVVVVLLGASAVLRGDWGQLVAVVGAAAAMFAFYFFIVLVYPAGMGGGDVKLAPVIGAATGFVGWGAVVVGAFAGFAVGAAVGLTVMAVRRVGMKHAIPFGPSMLAGGWIGATLGESIMGAYLGFAGLG